MKKLFENFQKFLRERGEEESDIFSFGAVIVLAPDVKKTKEDILSDLRAIEGVTVISVVDQKDIGTKNYSQLKIKIDTTPLRIKSLHKNLMNIKRRALSIHGVVKFEYTSRPEKI